MTAICRTGFFDSVTNKIDLNLTDCSQHGATGDLVDL